VHYNGSARRTETQPKTKIAADVVPFGADAIALRPFDLRYDEKLPVVVWVSDRFTWSNARAALMRDTRVASIVMTRAPGEDFWKSVRETTWLDPSTRYVINGNAEGAISFVADDTIPAGRYRRTGNVVAAAPAAIQSFAAGFHCRSMEEDQPANGSSR
jgi:hypothetical protein